MREAPYLKTTYQVAFGLAIAVVFYFVLGQELHPVGAALAGQFAAYLVNT